MKKVHGINMNTVI